MDRTVRDLAAAVAGISDGMTVTIGGPGGSGVPIEPIHGPMDRTRAETTVAGPVADLFVPEL